MKYILSALLFFILSPLKCTASNISADDAPIPKTFQPGPCLSMLADKFQEPHRRNTVALSRLSFKEIALSDIAELGSKENGMTWAWKHPHDHEIPTWYAISCIAIGSLPDQKYALSFWHLRAFYQTYDQLEPESNMQKLWHQLFDD